MTATDTPREARATLAQLMLPRDAASLGAFRALFGAVALFGVLRFWAYGWIDELYLNPTFHFTYRGFEWVRPWPDWQMKAHFLAMALAAAGLCLGVRTRLSGAAFFLLFTYVELIDKATYLNHYYFVSLVSLLLVVLPSGAAYSLDSYRRRRLGRPQPVVRRWHYLALQVQVGLVYLHAGLAKLGPDWLVHAEPLTTWLGARADLPLIGPLLALPATAHVMSVLGAAYDLSIPFWLSWHRTRKLAFAVGVLFHVSVWLLFPIGIFSWVMIASTSVFFAHDWPRRIGAWTHESGGPPARQLDTDGSIKALAPERAARWGLGLVAVHLLMQALLPLRGTLLYPGNVNWHEQGFRFAWRVMLIEKAGQVDFRVAFSDGRPDTRFYPRAHLTALQYRMMSTQPDMIQQYAWHIRDLMRSQGHSQVQVFANAWANLNGRRSQRLIDERVDLAGTIASLGPAPWILPLSTSRLASRR